MNICLSISYPVLVHPAKFSLFSLCVLDTMHHATGMETGSDYTIPLRRLMESRLA